MSKESNFLLELFVGAATVGFVVVLVVSKLTRLLAWSWLWVWVLSPLWIYVCLFLFLFIVKSFSAWIREK